MQTQDAELKQIQAQNEQARKKLESFRSGLQKLMNKKTKKPKKHQPPSHDIKSPQNRIDNQYFSMNSVNSAGGMSSALKSPSVGKQMDFGFNSTLFRQIGDETVNLSNSSVVNEQQDGSNFGYNSVPNKEYYSASSNQSGGFYNPNSENNDSQSFKKSSKLFSEIDELINKANKASKLPVKPIQKYFDKLQTKMDSSFPQFDLSLSKSVTQVESNHMTYTKNDNTKNLSSIKQVDRENKQRSLSAKQEVKAATSFLKNIRFNTDSIKSPPLPPPLSQRNNEKKSNQQQKAEKYHNQKTENHYNQNINFYDKIHEYEQEKERSVSKLSPTQNSVQTHRNKIKSTLNQRKKIVKDEGILDDSIELQLSSEEQNQNQIQQESQNNHKGQKLNQIKKLEEEKEKLLKELEEIQQQLQKLQND